MGLAVLSFSSFYLNYRPDGTRYAFVFILLPELSSRWDLHLPSILVIYPICMPSNLGEVNSYSLWWSAAEPQDNAS